MRAAELLFPANRQTPIAANLMLASPAADAPMPVTFDWRHSGGEAWTIDVLTESGQRVKLLDGGSRLEVDGAPQATEGAGEYATLYRDFIDLIDERRSHVDVRPLRLCADAFLLGRRTIVEEFHD